MTAGLRKYSPLFYTCIKNLSFALVWCFNGMTLNRTAWIWEKHGTKQLWLMNIFDLQGLCMCIQSCVACENITYSYLKIFSIWSLFESLLQLVTVFWAGLRRIRITNNDTSCHIHYVTVNFSLCNNRVHFANTICSVDHTCAFVYLKELAFTM